MKLKPHFLRTLFTWGVLVVFMLLVQPDKLPVVVLIVPFLLLFMALYSSWSLLVAAKARFVTRSEVFVPKRRLGLALSITTVLLIILQSLGQLTVKDVVTLLAIVTLGYLYLVRNRVSDA